MSSDQHTRNPALSDYRGPEPAKVGDEAAPIPPVSDEDPGAAAPAREEPGDPPARPTDAPAAPAPKPKSPFEDKRAAIAERFGERRKLQNDEPDPNFVNPGGVYGKLAGEAGDDGSPKPEGDEGPAPLSPGPAAKEPAKPETMTLVVNGRTVTKTLAEVARLSELDEGEVKADPKRATRYAQLELAKQAGLDEVKQLRRDTPSRHPDDAGTRPASPDPKPGSKKAGTDDSDPPPASRDTSDDELEQLIDDIQISAPKDVAPKLKSIIEKAAKSAAASVVQDTESDRLHQGEVKSLSFAVKEFTDAHPEVIGKPAIAAAIKEGLVQEYRIDLRTALIAEGDSEEEADELLSKASPDDIRNAHLARRLRRNPHVRPIDKAMMESVYGKVRADFGVTDAAPQPQGLSREARKQVLPTQPRRASLPPATPQAPAAPQSRRDVVAEMASRTGRKRSSLPR